MLIDTEKMKEMLERRTRNLQQLIKIEEHNLVDLSDPMTKGYFDTQEVINKLALQYNTTIEVKNIIEEYEYNFKND